MNEKVVVRSSARDLHGLKTGKELLSKAVEAVNGQYKMRQLANHRRDYPPCGYLNNAVLVEQTDIDLVVAEQFKYTQREEISWDKNLVSEKPPYPVKFKKRGENIETLAITLDPNNFTTRDKFLDTINELKAGIDEPFEIITDTRKAYQLDNRLILTLATYYGVVHPFVSPFLKKIGEKIAEDIATDIYNTGKKKLKRLYENLRKTITATKHHTRSLKNPLEIIFEIPGTPYIELHTKSNDADKVVKAIAPARLTKVHKRVNELMEKVEIEEAHFFLNDRGQWQFSYLITNDGTLIGTKTIFKKRDQLVKRIDLSPTKGFSIGADVTYQDLENEL